MSTCESGGSSKEASGAENKQKLAWLCRQMGGPKILGEEESRAKARLTDHKASVGCGSSEELKRSAKVATNTTGGPQGHPITMGLAN